MGSIQNLDLAITFTGLFSPETFEQKYFKNLEGAVIHNIV